MCSTRRVDEYARAFVDLLALELEEVAPHETLHDVRVAGAVDRDVHLGAGLLAPALHAALRHHRASLVLVQRSMRACVPTNEACAVCEWETGRVGDVP